MTNEEAIEYLKWIRPIRPYSLDKIKVQESIDLAIKALEFINENYPKTFIDYLNGEQI